MFNLPQRISRNNNNYKKLCIYDQIDHSPPEQRYLSGYLPCTNLSHVTFKYYFRTHIHYAPMPDKIKFLEVRHSARLRCQDVFQEPFGPTGQNPTLDPEMSPILMKRDKNLLFSDLLRYTGYLSELQKYKKYISTYFRRFTRPFSIY